MTPSTPAPDWDMTPYFDSFEGDAYLAFRGALHDDLDRLAREIEGLDALTGSEARWAAALVGVEDANARLNHLGGYLGCLSAADSRDERVAAEDAALAVAQAKLRKILVGVRAALGEAPDAAFDALLALPEVAAVAHYLRRLRERARFAMDPERESLAADLDTTGLSAWGRLYSRVSGKLEFDLEVPGQAPRRLPVSMARSLFEDPDPGVRRAAFQGANRAWESQADVMASCLNAISGTRLLLYERRGVEHFLDPALFDASITRRTLDTLLGVVRERAELPRAMLRRKAGLLGLDALGFQDQTAPLPFDDVPPIPYEVARGRVQSAFADFHPDLAAFAGRAFEGRWIDWSARPGKQQGGFCSSSPVIGQSRIFLTYQQTLGDLAVLAHELGHAFHSHVMRDMRPWARRYPMTLAETASTFAEQLIVDAVLGDPEASPQDRATLLDARMQDAAAYLLNIPMRFHFEERLYQERAAGELSVTRLCELMLDAQRTWYGDALADDQLDPWFWASKLHFYIAGLSFYNFPYTFGYLFSLGIVARAREAGPGFVTQYVDLLRRTGSDSAEGVAREALGVDLEAPDFWHASIDAIEAESHQFTESTEALFAN